MNTNLKFFSYTLTHSCYDFVSDIISVGTQEILHIPLQWHSEIFTGLWTKHQILCHQLFFYRFVLPVLTMNLKTDWTTLFYCFILPWKALTLYTQTSVQYPYSLYSSPYISFNTDRENLFYNQNFLGWWSFPLFSWL